MNVISQDAFAKIAVNKSLLKEYSSSEYQRVVYLNDGDEFQLQLFNPEQHPIAAKIFLNGDELSDILVIRPGERIWLERYLDKSRKFKFSTYEIENSNAAKNATALNGEVKVQFYHEKKKPQTLGVVTTYGPVSVYYSNLNYTIPNYTIKTLKDFGPCSDSYDATPISNVKCCSSLAASIEACDSTITTQSACTAKSIDSLSLETGRVEEGSYSNQKFCYVNYDFESYSFRTETISILPLSRKPVTAADLKKKYCSNCGRKLSPKHKFCPYCGTKVD